MNTMRRIHKNFRMTQSMPFRQTSQILYLVLYFVDILFWICATESKVEAYPCDVDWRQWKDPASSKLLMVNPNLSGLLFPIPGTTITWKKRKKNQLNTIISVRTYHLFIDKKSFLKELRTWRGMSFPSP